MAKKMAGRNWGNLISSLNEHKIHFSSAHENLRDAVDLFCKRLKDENIRHSKISSDGNWGYQSLLKIFTDTFDPVLLKLFPSESLTREILFSNDITLPFAENLVNKDSYNKHAEKIQNTATDLESILSNPEWLSKNQDLNIEDSEIFKSAESLELISNLFDSIFRELNVQDELTWCSACFRRANDNSKHCHLHLSTADTSYRAGKRLKEKLSDETKAAINQNRSKRISLGENFQLYSKVSDIPEKVTHLENAIIVSPTIKNLVFVTQNKSWGEALNSWEFILKLLPNVTEKFTNNPKDFDNWNDFRSALIDALDNQNEHTKHPYWFFLMLVEADNWLGHASGFKDERFTNTKDNIIELSSQGLSNIKIANKLGVSRQYVGQIKEIFT